ncbi:MAG: DUF4157 domain-containing protein [Bacteroidota bacterium]
MFHLSHLSAPVRSPRIDPFEQQADRLADRVVKGEKVPSVSPTAVPPIQAKEQPAMTGKTSGVGGMQTTGKALDRGTLHRMNRSFGRDFSQVRIHTGARAAQQCEQVGARAFTYGRDIYFNRGEYRVQQRAGQQLLAHELTHVLQQGALDTSSKGAARIQRAAKKECANIANFPELRMPAVLAMIDRAWEESRRNEKFTGASMEAHNAERIRAHEECLDSGENLSLADCPPGTTESWEGRERYRNSRYRETSFFVMPDGAVSGLSKSDLPWKVSISIDSGALAAFHSHPTEKTDLSAEDAQAYRKIGGRTRLYIINRRNIQLIGGDPQTPQILATFRRRDLEACGSE